MSNCPRIVYTAGEPAGIGPDLAIYLAEQYQDYELIVIADPAMLWQRAEQLGLHIDCEQVDLDSPPLPTPAGVLRYLPVQLAEPVIAGELNQHNSAYVIECLRLASAGCLEGQFDALITGPVHKGVINQAGIDFTGHTEFFADQASVEKVVMMLASSQLRVALATTHLPLQQVSETITQPVVEKTLRITHQALQKQFGITQPRIAVCGLNPHAGENGYLGREEIDVIEPVLDQLKTEGMLLTGPWPADTIFLPERLVDYDAVLAMYHDQGLPVLKYSGFSRAVNITLGLPYIRTSVDHGTALDLAGTNHVKTGSLEAALVMAADMAVHSQQ